MKKPRFKIGAMIQALGGDAETVVRLGRHGFSEPPVATVAAWRRRNSAPGGWAIALLYVCVRDDVLDNLDKIRMDQ